MKEEIIARPRLSPTEKRTEILQIRVSPIERAKIEAKADQTGLTMSEYLRGVALKPKLKVMQTRDVPLATHQELQRIGVNMNQIAKAMNAGQQNLPASLVIATEKLHAIFDVIYADLTEDW